MTGDWSAPDPSWSTPDSATPSPPPPPIGYAPPPGYGPQPGYGPPPPPPPGWGATAPQPGAIPLRPLGVGEILDGAFSVMRAYPRVTLGLSAIVVTLAQLPNLVLSLAFQNTEGIGVAGGVTAGLGWLVATVFAAVSSAVLTGMLTVVVAEAVLGRPVTAGQVWPRVRRRFWALLGASLIAGVLPFLGLILLIVPGMFLWATLAFTTPALLLEDQSVRGAVRRSWRLAKPQWFRIWGIRALGALIAAVLQGMVAFPLLIAGGFSVATSGSPDDVGVLFVILTSLATIVAGTVTAPFSSGVVAIAYIDRRMRAEGLDVTLAQSAAARPATL